MCTQSHNETCMDVRRGVKTGSVYDSHGKKNALCPAHNPSKWQIIITLQIIYLAENSRKGSYQLTYLCTVPQELQNISKLNRTESNTGNAGV